MPRKKKTPNEKKSVGRPKFIVDMAQLEKLCKLQLSLKIMADILGCHPETLRDNYSAQIENFQSDSKRNIAAVLFDEGINKRKDYAVKMLSQKHLGYADKVQQQDSPQKELENLTDEELDQEIEKRKL